MSVTDQGYPQPKTDTAAVAITVQRDVALPVFDRESYRRDISESIAVNTSVSQVHAEMDGIVVSVSCVSCRCQYSVHSVQRKT